MLEEKTDQTALYEALAAQDQPHDRHRVRQMYIPPTTRYCVPCSHDPHSQGAPYRACPAATLLLAICMRGGDSQIYRLIQDLPAWVMEDFLQKGLHHAIDACEFDTAREFLKQGAKMDSEAIKVAHSKGRAVEFIELSIECGWDVNTPEGCDTALAKFVEFEPIVACLLRNGADPNFGRPRLAEPKKPEHKSGYALDCAASSSSRAVVDLLLKAGARKEYSIALHKATQSQKITSGRIAMMQHLIGLGFDVNAVDKSVEGYVGLNTPLELSILCRSIDKATLLVQNGADPYLESCWRSSAFKFAQLCHRHEFIDMFLKYCPRDETSKVVGG